MYNFLRKNHFSLDKWIVVVGERESWWILEELYQYIDIVLGYNLLHMNHLSINKVLHSLRFDGGNSRRAISIYRYSS